MRVTDYLREFIDILLPIHSGNMVIGGIWALKLHGLKVRDTNDLDIILYSPSESTMQSIWDAVMADDPEDYPQDFPNSPRRSFKVERNGLTLDFLIERDQIAPLDLLCVPYSDRLWGVQRIDVIMDAKRKYGRDKDHEDFVKFGEENFKW